MRIVSLLPSTTEILFAIGAGDHVMGVTFECDYPPEARTRRIVSNTTLPEGLSPGEIDAEVRARMAAGEDLYRLDEGVLADLDPDVVVTQDLCAVCAVDVANVDDALAHLGCRARVVTIDPMTLDAVLDSIVELGAVTGHDDEAAGLCAGLRARLAAVAAVTAGRPRPRMAVIEWTDPLFCAGHWVPDLVEAAGARSVLGAVGQRSHPIPPAALSDAAPDIVVVAPCGYRLDGAADLAESLMATGVIPAGVQVWAVDADAMFVRPRSSTGRRRRDTGRDRPPRRRRARRARRTAHRALTSGRPLDEPHPARLPTDHPRLIDILDAHRAALRRGDAGYLDPVTGLYVLTAAALADRGTCCEQGCRHCPYLA